MGTTETTELPLAEPRWSGVDHQKLGGREPLAFAGGFAITWGDVVALSGDFFNPDDLIAKLSRPGRSGVVVDSQDEVVFALKRVNAKDDRFATGGPWANYAFSDAVVKAVDDRYRVLAANNLSHFVAPFERDANGVPICRPKAIGSIDTYRALHLRALRAASQAGDASAGPLRALEAAAQHFLTDSFAAGHIRTPTGAIREYWGARYPLFFHNLLQKIALDTAIAMNDQPSPLTWLVTVKYFYSSIWSTVEQMAGSLPEVNLGDLFNVVFHDRDNDQGVQVGPGEMLVGERDVENPDPSNRSNCWARVAVQAGRAELAAAAQLGAKAAQMTDRELLAAVRGTGKAPEDYVPQPAVDVPAQNWKAAALEDLWNKPALGTAGPTLGDLITQHLRAGETHDQIDGLQNNFPESKWSIHPRQAYVDGFLKPLVANPEKAVLSILHWAPDYGLADGDRADVAKSVLFGLFGTSRAAGLTTESKSSYVKLLLSSSDAQAGQMAVGLFRVTEPTERKRLYELVEGHSFAGALGSKDRLYEGLAVERRNELERLLRVEAPAMLAVDTLLAQPKAVPPSAREELAALPAIGELPLDQLAAKLWELDDGRGAEVARTTPDGELLAQSTSFFGFGAPDPWKYSAHSIGYLPLLVPGTTAVSLQPLAAVAADASLKNARLNVHLDRLNIYDYPGRGNHKVLLNFSAFNQLAATEAVSFSQCYDVNEGSQAGVVGYPIFIGISVGTAGLAMDCATVNVSNDQDETILRALQSEAFVGGLNLLTTAQPVVKPLTDMMLGLTTMLAKRHRNVLVQKFKLGLDFTDGAMGGRLAEGNYVVAQVPNPQAINWSDWVFNRTVGSIQHKDHPDQALPYNYVVFRITRHQ